eukprot:Gb_34407 [translate_table: standard]
MSVCSRDALALVGQCVTPQTELPMVAKEGKLVVELDAILEFMENSLQNNISTELLIKWNNLPIDDATCETEVIFQRYPFFISNALRIRPENLRSECLVPASACPLQIILCHRALVFRVIALDTHDTWLPYYAYENIAQPGGVIFNLNSFVMVQYSHNIENAWGMDAGICSAMTTSFSSQQNVGSTTCLMASHTVSSHLGKGERAYMMVPGNLNAKTEPRFHIHIMCFGHCMECGLTMKYAAAPLGEDPEAQIWHRKTSYIISGLNHLRLKQIQGMHPVMQKKQNDMEVSNMRCLITDLKKIKENIMDFLMHCQSEGLIYWAIQLAIYFTYQKFKTPNNQSKCLGVILLGYLRQKFSWTALRCSQNKQAGTKILNMVKKTPAYKNKLKALELERNGGMANKRKGPKQKNK